MVLVASNFLVWVVVLLLVVAVIALARQVAMLREQMEPTGAMAALGGLKAGDPAPIITAHTIDGRVVTIGGVDGRNRLVLLLFVEPECPTCRKIVRIAMVTARAQQLTLIFVGEGEGSAYRAMQQKLRMNAHDLVASSDIGPAYRIGKLPTAVLIASDGRLAAMGPVGTRHHLESLLTASRPAE